MATISPEIGTFSFSLMGNDSVIPFEAFDVAEWEIIFIKADTIAAGTAWTPGDVTFSLETSITKDDYPEWVAVGSAQVVPGGVGASHTGEWIANLRKWARIRVNDVPAVAHIGTVRFTAFFKKRS